jgi:hypothetical protein
LGHPTDEDVAGIAAQVATRVVRMLRRRGKVEADDVAAIEGDDPMLLPCIAASVQRVGMLGEGAGRSLRRPGRRRDVEVASSGSGGTARRRWSSTRSTSSASSRRWCRDRTPTWFAPRTDSSRFSSATIMSVSCLLRAINAWRAAVSSSGQRPDLELGRLTEPRQHDGVDLVGLGEHPDRASEVSALSWIHNHDRQLPRC